MKAFSLCLALGLSLGAGLRADARTDYLAAAEAQKAGRWDEAAQGYSKVTAQQPGYAPAWKQLASARYYLGDHEGAVASADRYLALKPEDTAFAAWADRLRKKLGLPPRATPSPTPGPALPAPVIALAPTPESLIGIAPPPGADAEIVPMEQAVSLNSDAAAKIAQLEAQEAERSALQMAEEGSSLRRRRAPARGSLKLGLRLMGGWAIGTGSFEHGEDVESPTAYSTRRYNGAPAGGGSAVIELLAQMGERLDLGVGVYPLLWSDQKKSSQTSTVTRSNSSEASAALLPIMAGLTLRQPLAKGFNGLLSGGFGIVPSTTLKVKSQTVQTYGGGLDVTSIDARLDYGLTPAWRVMAGGEWVLGPRLSLDLGVQALGASFADAGGVADVEVTDQTGATLFKAKDLVVAPQPLQVMSISFLAGVRVLF